MTMVKTVLNGEYEIIIPKHRADRPEWYTAKGWERARLAALHSAIKENRNQVVYYVGAEEGEMPALCQMWGAKVVLFEPNPKVWSNIKAIWDANELEYPVSFCGFASNKNSGEQVFYRGFPPSAGLPIISNHGFMNLSEIDVATTPQVRIDTVVGVKGARKPTIITMDVEGSEWEVLRGAEQILRDHHPKIFLSLHPEFMYEMYHEYAFDLRHWLTEEFGYTETLLDYQHEVHLLYEVKNDK